MSGAVWLTVTLVGFGYEFWALRRRDDEHRPFTYYIRRVLNLRDRRQPLWWLGLGFWLWLGFHFFVDG